MSNFDPFHHIFLNLASQAEANKAGKWTMRNCRIEIHSNQVTIFLKWLYLNRFICTVLDVEKLLDGSEPETLEQNFPTIQEQSRHWSLNQEQNDAFILMAAALLQHINNTNQLSELEHIQSMISKISFNMFQGFCTAMAFCCVNSYKCFIRSCSNANRRMYDTFSFRNWYTKRTPRSNPKSDKHLVRNRHLIR